MGTTFKIYLPVGDNNRYANDTGSDEEEKDLQGTETVLLVEDNPDVRDMTHRILEKLGYRVYTAESPEIALGILTDQNRNIELLLTDVVMPGMNGRQLYQEALRHHSNLRVLYMSGYTENVIAHRGVLDEGIHYIQKPFTSRDLAFRIREAFR